MSKPVETPKPSTPALQCAAAPRIGPPPVTDRANQVTTISADEMEVRDRNQFLYQGSVELQRADQSLTTDQARYNHETGLFEAEGSLRYQEHGTEISGDRGRFNSKTDRGTIENASYRMSESSANGEASVVEKDGAYVSRYHQATYSTCDPEARSWQLEASEIELDELEGWGSAKDAVVRFKGVPILYTPTYTFPLDERRKSGFLFPSWGYDDIGGGDFSIPYYWNIAPNQDATLTPHIVSKRGAGISGNFRYLNSNSSGQVDGSILPSDDIYGDDRYQLKVDHQGTLQMEQLANTADYSINYATLSDTQYLSDFGNNLGLASTPTLEQNAKISYSQDRWKLSALLSDHYNISATTEPYRRLPQIDGAWSSEGGNDQLVYGVEGQYVRFDHDTSSDADRYWVKPNASYHHTLLGGAAYIKPGISISQSHYSLESGGDSSMTVPHYTLESGLFLERDTENYLHTLEPSIKLSHIPEGKSSGHSFETNSDDSSEFYGKDSAPHTKLITLAVNSDLLRNSDGSKLLSTSLERSRDLRNSRTQNWQDLIGKVTLESGSHSTGLKIHLDKPQSSYSSWSNTLHADYQFDNDTGQLMNLGYIHERGSKKQVDLSAAWRLTPHWSMIGRYNHELISTDNHRLEDLIGVKYESCCWSARFTRRNYFTGTSSGTNQYDTTWFLSLELKGLGDLGKSSSLDQLLTQSIKGYKVEE